VNFARLMMMSRMNNMSYFIAHIPTWSLSAGSLLPCSHRQDLMMCPLFKTRTTINFLISFMN